MTVICCFSLSLFLFLRLLNYEAAAGPLGCIRYNTEHFHVGKHLKPVQGTRRLKQTVNLF